MKLQIINLGAKLILVNPAQVSYSNCLVYQCHAFYLSPLAKIHYGSTVHIN